MRPMSAVIDVGDYWPQIKKIALQEVARRNLEEVQSRLSQMPRDKEYEELYSLLQGTIDIIPLLGKHVPPITLPSPKSRS